MGTSLLLTVPATTGAVGTAGGVRADTASNGKRCLTTSAPTIAATAIAEIAEMMTLCRIRRSPPGACASAGTGRRLRRVARSRTRGGAQTRIAQFGRAQRDRRDAQL